jgi:uncharacterized RDD family membrane protein YckC
MPKPPRPVDSRIAIITPENIAFEYCLAGPFRRLPAFAIDVALRVVILAAIVAGVMLSAAIGIEGIGVSVLLVSWFVLSWFYGGFFETIWNGQTPGKRLLRLRVLTVEGEPINAMQAVLRNVLRDVDAMPPTPLGLGLYTLGLLTMAANDRYQRLGDLASGTIVVVERRSLWQGLTPMSVPEALELAHELPAKFVPQRSLSHALSAYVSRRRLFSPARRMEIASTLAGPLAESLKLRRGIDPDLLLCALYYKKFIADSPGQSGPAASAGHLVEVAAG